MPNSSTHTTSLTASLNTTYQPRVQHQQPKVIDAPRYQRWQQRWHQHWHQRWYNRLRRGLLAFVPWTITVDDEFVCGYLTPKEYVLFTRMDVRDQQHACWVAKTVLNCISDASDVLVAAALLHDVGKADVPFVPLERILVHILERIYTHKPPLTPRQRGWRGVWQRKCHHESYGAQLIRHSGGRFIVAHIIETTAQLNSAQPDGTIDGTIIDVLNIANTHNTTDTNAADTNAADTNAADTNAADISLAAYLLHRVDQCF